MACPATEEASGARGPWGHFQGVFSPPSRCPCAAAVSGEKTRPAYASAPKSCMPAGRPAPAHLHSTWKLPIEAMPGATPRQVHGRLGCMLTAVVLWVREMWGSKSGDTGHQCLGANDVACPTLASSLNRTMACPLSPKGSCLVQAALYANLNPQPPV